MDKDLIDFIKATIEQREYYHKHKYSLPMSLNQQVDQILSIPEIALGLKLLDLTKDICSECHGGLWVMKGETHGMTASMSNITCPTCHGTGKDPNSSWHPERLILKD